MSSMGHGPQSPERFRSRSDDSGRPDKSLHRVSFSVAAVSLKRVGTSLTARRSPNSKLLTTHPVNSPHEFLKRETELVPAHAVDAVDDEVIPELGIHGIGSNLGLSAPVFDIHSARHIAVTSRGHPVATALDIISASKGRFFGSLLCGDLLLACAAGKA
jgi:hypothetical protein